MIDHVVLFALKTDAPRGDLPVLIARLRAVAARIDGLEEYRLGLDLQLRPGNDDLAIVARFVDRASLDRYLTDSEHLAILAEYGPRLMAEKHSVQFEDDGA